MRLSHEFFQYLLAKLRKVEMYIVEYYIFVLLQNSRYVSLCFLLHIVVVVPTERIDYFFQWLLLPSAIKMGNLLNIYLARVTRRSRKYKRTKEIITQLLLKEHRHVIQLI